MKEMDNIDNLVRDLDTLGVQREIDLMFVMNEKLWYGEEEDIPIRVEENTYNDCLRHNDEHHVKIISATIHYSVIAIGFDVAYTTYSKAYELSSKSAITQHSFDSILMSFSNGVELKFTTENPIREINRIGLTPRPMIYLGSGSEIFNFHLEIKNTIDEDTYLLSSVDSSNKLEPDQAKEYLKFSENKSCIHSFFEILEKYFMREGITEGILEELFL